MKFMSICCRLVPIFFLLSLPGTTVAALKEGHSDADLVQNLKRLGPSEFAKEAKQKAWPTPAISSAWAMEKIRKTDPKHQEAEKQNRDFGSQVLQTLDEMAPTMRNADVSVLAERCQSLLDLAEWLLRADGYANVILSTKATDMASAGIARLICDLQVPFEAARQLYARSRSVYPKPDQVARVLNIEAGQMLFEESGQTREKLLKKWEGMELRSQFGELRAKSPQQAEAVGKRLREMGIDVESPVGDEKFFRDAVLLPCPTARTCWEGKHHKQLVLNLEAPLDKKLEALIAFREKVGAFPLRPTQPGFPHMPEGKAAFREAWLPHASAEDRTLYATAWAVYQEISSGTLCERDMQIIRQDEARKAVKKP